MADYLVIHVSDLATFPGINLIDDIAVQVAYNGGSSQPATARDGDTPGTRRIAIPAGTTQARVRVDSSNDTFWSAAVDLTFVTVDKKLQVDGGAALRQRHLTKLITYKNGTDDIIEIRITVGQLRDIEATVLAGTLPTDFLRPTGQANPRENAQNFHYRPFFNSAIGSTNGFRVPDPHSLHVIRAPWRPPATPTDMRDEASWDARMNCTRMSEAPIGRLYLAERRNLPTQDHGPRLIAIWRPRFVDFPTSPQGHGFHVFFHPFIDERRNWTPPDFYNCARRYMFNQKGLVQQHYWTGRQVVFVMPIANAGQAWMGDLTTSWPAFERFLREVLFFMLNMENASRLAMLLQYVDRIALSGFSFGIRGVTPLLAAAPPTSRLREVYSFDGVDDHGRAPAFNRALTSWLGRARADSPLYFRVYTQDPSPNQEGLANLVGDTTNPPRVSQRVTVQQGWDRVSLDSGLPRLRPANYTVATQEWVTGTRSLHSMPHVAWQGLVSPYAPDTAAPMTDVDRFYGAVHQYPPEYFAFHAINQSGFPR